MNFEKMVKDGLLNVHKAQNGRPLDVEVYETSDSHSYGQIDKNTSMLHGIGRKVVQTEQFVEVFEGQFKHDLLNGWGRSIKFFKDGHTS